MAKIIFATLVVIVFIGLPVWLFDAFVLPELAGLKDVYGNIEDVANQAAGTAQGTLKPQQ